jgi:hypothetical protein
MPCSPFPYKRLKTQKPVMLCRSINDRLAPLGTRFQQCPLMRSCEFRDGQQPKPRELVAEVSRRIHFGNQDGAG